MNPTYTPMQRVRVSVEGIEEQSGYVLDSKWLEEKQYWVYKVNLPDEEEFFDCWFSEKHLQPY